MGCIEGRTYWVTPTLFVGDLGPSLPHTPVTTAREALQVIHSGGQALLPAGSWSTVREILTALGGTPEVVEDRIHFAQTGRILHAV